MMRKTYLGSALAVRILSKVRPAGLVGLGLMLALAGAPLTSSAGPQAADPEAELRSAGRERRCGTRDVDDAEVLEVERALDRFRAKRAEAGPDPLDKATGSETIRVFFHVIMNDNGSKGAVSDSTLDGQIDVLNEAFRGAEGGANTPFRFVRAGVTRTNNSAWFSMDYASPREREAKEALHVWGRDVLNFYTAGPPGSVLGWATFPWNIVEDPVMDGVVCRFSTLPGSASNYNTGKVATHEVGHWLGLYHTFQGGCSGVDDQVSDTPAQASPTSGCPSRRDSCPNSPGLDPTTNFMDYSDDDCMREFTLGQASRMDSLFLQYRDVSPDDMALSALGDDIALLGIPGWTTIPLASSTGDGNWIVTNRRVGEFGKWAAVAPRKITGDFNGDGLADFALLGVSSWYTIPVALANGNGRFTVVNQPVDGFAAWSATDATTLTGDFNGDGRTDIALVGGAYWSSVPVAFSNGDGSFTVTNHPLWGFPVWAQDPRAARIAGDFNGDGRTDIALTGPDGWSSLPVAFSNGNGTFAVTAYWVGDFAGWSSLAKKLVGDFNGDGRTDVALTGGWGWSSVPVAFSNGNGTFTVTNAPIGDFAGWATLGPTKVLGDFNGDGRTDIALTGVRDWWTLPVAFSNGDGSFTVANNPLADFAGWAGVGPTVLTGDFDRDGRTDIALTGVRAWDTIPIAFSQGNGWFSVTNESGKGFAFVAALPQAEKLTGNFRN
jgi:hypothetical protein